MSNIEYERIILINIDIVEPTFKKDKSRFRSFLNDKLHSFNDEPSFINFETHEKKWHFEDQLHRDNDLPAVEKFLKTKSGAETYQRTWYQNGICHRDGDKPAQILIKKTYFNNGNLRTFEITKKWFKKGKYHRDTDKPSYISIVKYYNTEGKETKGEFNKKYYVNGFLHRISDSPSVYRIGKSTSEINKSRFFYNEGKAHRDGGKPAFERSVFKIKENNKRFRHYHQRKYIVNNLIHRDGDNPAVIYWNKDLSSKRIALNEFYYIKGNRHRDGDKPAIILDNPFVEKTLIYLKDNKAHRDGNKPAFIAHQYSNEGNKTFFTFYNKGTHIPDDKNLIYGFAFNLLSSYGEDCSSFETKDYPLSQLFSIIKSLDNIDYVYDVPYSQMLSKINQIFNVELI